MRFDYPEGWNYHDIETIISRVSNEYRNNKECEWQKKAKVIARGLRFRSAIIPSATSGIGRPSTWRDAAYSAIRAVQSDRRITTAWQIFADRISHNCKKRKVNKRG